MDQGRSKRWSPPTEFGRYRRIRVLGRGAMGQVYLYYDTSLERQVAIKFVEQNDREQRQQILDEARAAATIQHPNIVTIFDTGEIENVSYIVSEYICGSSLDHEKPIRPWLRIVDIANDLASALAAAHKHGVLGCLLLWRHALRAMYRAAAIAQRRGCPGHGTRVRCDRTPRPSELCRHRTALPGRSPATLVGARLAGCHRVIALTPQWRVRPCHGRDCQHVAL